MISVNKNSSLLFLSFIILFCTAVTITIVINQPRNKSAQSPSTISDCVQNTICKDCNIILLSVDSLRADHLQAFGYKRNTAPFFEDFVQKGVLFTNYYTSSFLTPISEMSVHTGMYPTSNGVVDFYSYLPQNTTTLAKFLAQNGYITSAYITSPEFVNFEAMKTNFEIGFKRYNFHKTYKRDEFNTITGILSHEKSLMSELDSISNDKFFMWIPIGIVHWPYGLGIHNWYDDADYNGPLKELNMRWYGTFNDIYDYTLYPNTQLTEKDIDYIRDKYDNGIRQFDIFFKELISALKDKNQLEKTIIVVQSEHGEGLHEHKYIAHYDIFDTQIHTPLFVYSPKINQGKTIETMSSSVDIFPTLTELVGLSSPSQVQGKSLVPNICGYNRPESEEVVFIERIPLWEEGLLQNDLRKFDIYLSDKRHRDIAIRTTQWKLILRTSLPQSEKIAWWKLAHGVDINYDPVELYDIQNDPLEQVNVVDFYPELKKGLVEKLLEWDRRTKKTSPENIEKSPILQYYF